MPINLKLYPPHWNIFSRWVRHTRARGQCECTGQCGLHRGDRLIHSPDPRWPLLGRRCTERHHEPARFARGTVRLTVAHLCHCNPLCANPAHVIAACQRCHLRIDIALHLKNRRNKRARMPQDQRSGTR